MPDVPIWKDAIQVNEEGSQYPYAPASVALSNGNTVVIWADDSDTVADGTGYDIMGQLFDRFGAKIGDPIFLNDGLFDGREDYEPKVAPTDDGGFVITFQHVTGSDTDYPFIRFDADGVPTGDDTLLISDSADAATFSDVEIVQRPDGTLVSTYRYDNGTDEDIYFQVRNADGSIVAAGTIRDDDDAVGGTSDPDDPKLAVLNDGRVVVAYRERDGSYGPEFVIINTDNTTTFFANVAAGNNAFDVDVAALSNGGFVITWREGNDVKARLYDSSASPEGGVLTLDDSVDQKSSVQVVGLKHGGFAVAYDNDDNDTVDVTVYDNTGAVVFDKTALDSTAGEVFDIDMSTTQDGRIVVNWTAYPDGSFADTDIFSMILDPRGDTIEVTDGTVTFAGRDGSAINGSDANDVFYGVEGDDDFSGKKGNDDLFGGSGDDEISGGKGKDMLEGGKGDDDIFGDLGDDMIFGGSGKDTMRGGSKKDTIKGGNGNDTAYGDGGADILEGGKKNDDLYGGGGADELKGGRGKDVLIGGKGKDEMSGDKGNDVFVFTSHKQSDTGAKRDVITDFTHNKDKIDLSGIDANKQAGGDQAFVFIGSDSFSDTSGELRAKVKNGDIILQADRNGDGVADFEIKLEGPVTVDGGDFIL